MNYLSYISLQIIFKLSRQNGDKIFIRKFKIKDDFKTNIFVYYPK